MELPPRARRIQVGDAGLGVFGGTTSACAENTGGGVAADPAPGNYLRVRGEYLRLMEYRKALLELPPRARRIPFSSDNCNTKGGTTSACAENTSRQG